MIAGPFIALLAIVGVIAIATTDAAAPRETFLMSASPGCIIGEGIGPSIQRVRLTAG